MPPPSHRRAAVTTGTIDLLGILSASQALSSETSLDRLQARVVEILGALTGATDVHLLLWEDDRQDWLLPAPAGTVPVGTGHETAVPLSVLRYVRRTGEPLVVADATADDRFARDPYLAGADCCALLAVPILSRSSLRAMLLLENRLLRGAFTADRLDAVTLIAGQLAVSLDNAQLYQQLTTSRARIVAAADQARRRIERDLHDGAQQRLVSLALQLRAVQAEVPPEAAGLRPAGRSWPPTRTAPWRSCRRSPAACTRHRWPAAGCARALPSLARRCPVPVRLELRVDRRLPDPIELAAYYAVAEALTNTIKYAHATVADVVVTAPTTSLQIWCATTAAAAPTSPAAPACSGSRTASRHSTAASPCTARPAPAPRCRSPCPSTTPAGPGRRPQPPTPPMTPAAAPPPLPGRPAPARGS